MLSEPIFKLEFLNLDPSKSVGPHSMSVDLLKILGPHISEALAKLVNQSFLKGIYPSKLKLAKVITLYKKDDPEIASNYRPISLLPLFSKLYERLMYRRLYSVLIYHKIIYPLQFGFQENHSVEHTLISMNLFLTHRNSFGYGLKSIETYIIFGITIFRL